MRRITLCSALALGALGCQLVDLEEPGSSREAIIGGTPTGLNHNAVSVMKIELPPDEDNPNVPRDPRWCTGTLIEAQTVLTVADCIYENLEEDMLEGIDLRFGSGFEDGTAVAVTDAVVHRYYSPDNAGRYNMALLRLESPPEGAQPVALSERPLDADDVGELLTVVGFGQTADDQPGSVGTRRMVQTPITAVEPRYILAGTNEETTCQGDAGSPGFLMVDDDPVLVSVTLRQTTCNPNVPRSRVDRELDTFIYPFIDRFSGPCPLDEVCDPGAECRSPDPDCEPCVWDGEVCEEDCPTRDWDCELGAFVGEECEASGECEEGGRCIAATDDEDFTYCSRPCEAGVDSCPSGMECTDLGDGAGECTWTEPSPGSQGFSCSFDEQCRSGICEETICVDECDPNGEPCPDPYTCGPSSVAPGTNVCLGDVFSGGGGFCSASAARAAGAGSTAATLLLLLGAWLATTTLVLRRRRRLD